MGFALVLMYNGKTHEAAKKLRVLKSCPRCGYKRLRNGRDVSGKISGKKNKAYLSCPYCKAYHFLNQ